jgi:hypothetical protein
MTESLRGGEAPEAIQPLAMGVIVSQRVYRMKSAGLLRALPALAMTALFTACASPEAGRRPGQAGADVKNWGHPIELHAGAEPYHETPCVTERVECSGPLPVFGPRLPPD